MRVIKRFQIIIDIQRKMKISVKEKSNNLKIIQKHKYEYFLFFKN
jgi:hypothetical protein